MEIYCTQSLCLHLSLNLATLVFYLTTEQMQTYFKAIFYNYFKNLNLKQDFSLYKYNSKRPEHDWQPQDSLLVTQSLPQIHILFQLIATFHSPFLFTSMTHFISPKHTLMDHPQSPHKLIYSPTLSVCSHPQLFLLKFQTLSIFQPCFSYLF